MFFRVCILLTICVSSAQKCGRITSTNQKIIGGKSVHDALYPWFAVFGPKQNGHMDRRYSQFCGGSLITKKNILSAAYCTIGKYKNFKGRFAAYFGVTDLLNKLRDAHEVSIEDYIVHPRYTKFEVAYDIAIVTLAKEVNNEPICFPVPSTDLPKSAEAIGFGTIGYHSSGFPLKSVYLHTVNMSIYNCGTDDGIFCFPNSQDERNICGKDSGGPLQYRDEDSTYTLLGIVPSRYCCRYLHSYETYTDVRYHNDWILSNLIGKVEINYGPLGNVSYGALPKNV